jgi:hypothetical protein
MSSIDEADSVFEADFGSRSFRVPAKRLDVDLGKSVPQRRTCLRWEYER